jgi:hypothetical protein
MTNPVLAPQSLGIKETREALAFGLDILVAGSKFYQKKNIEGVAALTKAATSLFPALDNIAQVGDEVRELSSSEIDTLAADVTARIGDVVPEKSHKIVQIAILVGVTIAKGVVELKQ